jgi:hypothetical protein
MRLRRLAIVLLVWAAVGAAGCSCCHKHAAPAPCNQGCPPPGPPVGGAVVPPPPAPVTSGYYAPVSAFAAPGSSFDYPVKY